MSTNNTPNPQAASTALDQVEIFAPGKRRAMNGQVYDIGAAELQASVAAYDPSLHDAPHVIGHPKTDDPAWGWVGGLAINAAGRLTVTQSRQVQPAFAEMVTGGQFPKRSAAFYHPEDPNNPKPGIWYLKHVGWLGAQPPAVKGLADVVAYGEASAEIVEFGEWDDQVNASLWRRLRDWLIDQFGMDVADKVVGSYDVETLQRAALQPDSDSSTPVAAYAEGTTPVSTPDPNAAAAAQLATRATELDAREASLKKREDDNARMLKSARSAGIAKFCETMIGEGRMLPAERDRWAAFMEALPDTAEVIEFAEGAPDKPIHTPAVKVFQDLIRSLPPRVEFAELAGRKNAITGGDATTAEGITAAAVVFQEEQRKAGREVSFEQAVQHIENTHKENAQ